MGRRSAPPRDAGPEAAARELVTHLDRTMRRVVLAGGRGPDESFSRSEIAVLDTIGAEGPLAMGEVAARVRLPLSTASRVVDRLVPRGMVERERPEENRRVVRVALGTGGRAFYKAALRSRITGARHMLRCLTANERNELVRLFRKIAASVADEFEG